MVISVRCSVVLIRFDMVYVEHKNLCGLAEHQVYINPSHVIFVVLISAFLSFVVTLFGSLPTCCVTLCVWFHGSHVSLSHFHLVDKWIFVMATTTVDCSHDCSYGYIISSSTLHTVFFVNRMS